MARKVIFSRKGFDSTTGGKPSPIIEDKFVSLPIPRADSGDFYKNFMYSPTENYLKLMKDLGINLYSEAHLDPDLKRTVLKERDKNWRGLFGQAGTSQGTLHNREVGKGDIFLFFGWFKEARKLKGTWKYRTDAPDIHAIYGYLEVDRVLDIKARNPVPPWTKYHPHIRGRREYGTQRNSVYMATAHFSKNSNIQGWGCFEYNKQLVLTRDGQKNRSMWLLPPCFQGEQISFTHAIKTWNVMPNEWIEMQTNGRGDQEVFISSNPQVVKWAEQLITSCSIYE